MGSASIPECRAAAGLITLPSRHPVGETVRRFTSMLAEEGLVVLAHIDHAAAAAGAGLLLRPTELLLFGNPAFGTPLMQNAQSVGIDLPLKALAWENANEQSLLSYNDPAWIGHRHGLSPDLSPRLKAIGEMLYRLARRAAGSKS